MLGLATGTWTHKTHHGPDSGEATTFPHIVFSAAGHWGYIQMAHFVGTPEMESRNGPDRLPELWTAITPRPDLGSGRVLNQSYSPHWELFNAVLHCSRRRQKEVDSWLLVVGNQTASLTPGPSFAHNLGCKCLNDQCEAIFDIYVSRPFQWHQKRLNARCFGPWCRVLNIQESRRTPNLQLFQVLGFTPTLGQSGVAT